MPLSPLPIPPELSVELSGLNIDLEKEYEKSREEMERLMAEPIKDFPRIDYLIDQLEMLQLAIKGQHGIKGNNPNE